MGLRSADVDSLTCTLACHAKEFRNKKSPPIMAGFIFCLSKLSANPVLKVPYQHSLKEHFV